MERRFVGRAEEVRLLRRALRAGPGLTVVRGEPGAGVSRLVDEVLDGSPYEAGCAGWTQLRAGCPDGPPDAAPPGPVADALAGLPHRPFEAPPPPVTGVLALVVPELADRLPPPPAAAADPEVRRGLLPRAVAALLTALGDTVLVVEDVHRADPASLAILRHLTAAPPARLRLLVTESTAPGLPLLALPSTGRLPVTEVAVRPWTRAETEEYVGHWLARHHAGRQHERPALTALVHHLTAGFPGPATALLDAAAPGVPGAPGAAGEPRREPEAGAGELAGWPPADAVPAFGGPPAGAGPPPVPAQHPARHRERASADARAWSSARPGPGPLPRQGERTPQPEPEPTTLVTRWATGEPPADDDTEPFRGPDRPHTRHPAPAPGLPYPETEPPSGAGWTPAPHAEAPPAAEGATGTPRPVGASPERPRTADVPWATAPGGTGTQQGDVVRVVREIGVPARVAREFAGRCEPLGEDARRVVEAAAVLGLAADIDVLAEVAGVGPGQVGAAVEACLGRSVLRADGRRVGFRHPLERVAALTRLSGPRLARLSLRAARALRRGPDGPPPLTELARLYRAAGREREAVRCLVVAADRAAAVADYTTATDLYTRSVVEDPRAAGRVRTAVKLARTAQLARAGEDVVAAVRRVLEEDDPPPRLRGEIRLHLSVVLRNQSGMALDSLNEVARAVPDLEVSDPQTAARAMAVAAIPSIKGWPVERHRAWLERCEALADRVTEPVARAAVAANRATALMLLGDPRCWSAAEALHGPAGSAMEAAHHTRGWTNLAHAATALGYGERAHGFLGLAAAGLADTSSPYVEGLTRTARLVLAWHEGAWQDLHEAADRTARLYAEIPDLTAEAMLVRGLTALHVLGDVPRARRDLVEAARVTRYDTGVILTASAAALARVHLAAGRPGQACEAVEETLGRLARTGGWVWAGELVPTAVEALHASGQGDRAGRLVADFAAGVAECDAPAARAALTTARALLARAEDRAEEAGALLAGSAAAWRLVGRPFDAARAAEARGECLLALGDAGGAAAVQEVAEVYRELGARWDVARCGRLLRRHDIVTTHRRGRLGYGDQLSPREREVAHLVVQGRANRDIAESLVLSTRTVEHHVARIMRKLNVASRTDITTT
ncbi:LuxR C-terminal-related transcriptional regulator [Streptomyces sp. NPDC003717]|uniref:LuxR C-terminal-related transcriptional regulator n=1 Tax=Streptomyces sp. NPDC003717 TaxID=3154276 RepID=UPI0033BC391D